MKKTIKKPSVRPSSRKKQSNTEDTESLLSLVRSEVNGPERWKEMLGRPPFYIAKMKPMSAVDSATRRWIRNESDERAAREGYLYLEERGQFTVDWITKHCCLYEGDMAGQMLTADDWQYEFWMQVFGWVCHDPDWPNRLIRRFRQAVAFIPKKNAKSPTLAATALYMLIGDGEHGQKCYSLARDRAQAMISHQHAIMMVRFSPELHRFCKIDGTSGEITYRPTQSVFKPVAGDNDKSTEGFNGSVFTDEIHVIDWKLAKRTTRTGISRSEPLRCEMSTTGENHDNYGYARYKQCEAIADGTRYSPRVYTLMYGIHEDTPMSRLQNDRAFVIDAMKATNPSLGRIVRPNEFMQDWQDSRSSLPTLREFARYRLNLWLRSGSSWLDPSDWDECGKKYSLNQLKKYPCVAGIDLSKNRDMTALVLMFAVPSTKVGIKPYIWPFFWLPEETARKYQSTLDFWKWEKYITFVPGWTINYSTVAETLLWIEDTFDLRQTGFDPYGSDILVDLMMNKHGWHEDQLLEVRQTYNIFGPPTEEFERLVLNHQLVHPNNPVLSWQAGHVEVLKNSTGQIRPVKPDYDAIDDDHRKIDGMVASVIALATLTNNPDIRFEMIDHLVLYEAEKLREIIERANKFGKLSFEGYMQQKRLERAMQSLKERGMFEKVADVLKL